MHCDSSQRACLDALADVVVRVLGSLDAHNGRPEEQVLEERLEHLMRAVRERTIGDVPASGHPRATRGVDGEDYRDYEHEEIGQTLENVLGEGDRAGYVGRKTNGAPADENDAEHGATRECAAEPRRSEPAFNNCLRELLVALGVPDVDAESEGLHDRLCRELKAIRKYFDRTRANLEQAVAIFNLDASLPTFKARLRKALLGHGELGEFLTTYRYCWQAFFAGTVMSLKPYWERLQESLSPAAVDGEVHERRQLPAGHRRAGLAGVSLYEGLMETVRVRVMAELRQRAPGVLKR